MLEYVVLYLLDVLIWLIIVTLLAETTDLEYFNSYCSYWCYSVMLLEMVISSNTLPATVVIDATLWCSLEMAISSSL